MGVSTKTKPAAVAPRVLDEFDAMFPDLQIAIVKPDGSPPHISRVADPRAEFARYGSTIPEWSGAKFVDPTRAAPSSCSLYLVVIIRDGREELVYADPEEQRALLYAKAYNEHAQSNMRVAVRPVSLEGLGIVNEEKPATTTIIRTTEAAPPAADNSGLMRLAAMGSVPQR